MDGVLVVGGCDKNLAGGLIGMLRANVPSIYVYGDTIKPGRWKGEDLSIVSAFVAVGHVHGRAHERGGFRRHRKNANPTTGSCGGMYTANTMAGSFKALGISLLGSSTMANPDHEKANSADRSTRVLVNAVEQHLKPKDIVRGNPSKTPWHW